MSWFFSCLRRNEDGSPIADTTVELRLDCVERVVAYYAPAACNVHPSRFVVRDRLTVDDLSGWSREPSEAGIAIDSRQADFEMATSCVRASTSPLTRVLRNVSSGMPRSRFDRLAV